MVSAVNLAHPALKPQSYHMHVRKTSNLGEKTARWLLAPQPSVAWPSENEVACPVPPAAVVPRRAGVDLALMAGQHLPSHPQRQLKKSTLKLSIDITYIAGSRSRSERE